MSLKGYHSETEIKENEDDVDGYQEGELLEIKDQLEDQIVKMNLELREKNERLLELLEQIEDVKIKVYARDKSISI